MSWIQTFPASYDLAIKDAQGAVQACRNDGKELIEIEIPTAGLESVPGGINLCVSYYIFVLVEASQLAKFCQKIEIVQEFMLQHNMSDYSRFAETFTFVPCHCPLK